MASKIEICNMALQRVSTARITSLDDGTASAVRCSLLYDLCAEDVMSQGPWRTVMARAQLAATTTTPDFEWSYEYQLPTDPRCLRILELYSSGSSKIPFEVEGDKILTNATSVYLKYMSFVSDPTKYGPYLTKAIVSRLAFELSLDSTGKATTREALKQQYEEDLINGLANDAVQGTSDMLNIDALTKDR